MNSARFKRVCSIWVGILVAYIARLIYLIINSFCLSLRADQHTAKLMLKSSCAIWLCTSARVLHWWIMGFGDCFNSSKVTFFNIGLPCASIRPNLLLEKSMSSRILVLTFLFQFFCLGAETLPRWWKNIIYLRWDETVCFSHSTNFRILPDFQN